MSKIWVFPKVKAVQNTLQGPDRSKLHRTTHDVGNHSERRNGNGLLKEICSLETLLEDFGRKVHVSGLSSQGAGAQIECAFRA